MDYNNDGLMDLMCGEYEGTINLFTRQADGSLKEEPILCYSEGGKEYAIDIGRFSAPQLVDWNEDGYLDLAVCGYFSSNLRNVLNVFINTGDDPDSPVYTAAGRTRIPNIRKEKRAGLDIIDLDFDGDKDLVMAVGNTLGYVYFAENIGTNSAPVFKKAVKLATPSGPIFYPYIKYTQRIRESICNWNDDGIPDLMVGTRYGKIFIHIGIGVSVEEGETQSELSSGLQITLLENPVVNGLISVDVISFSSRQAVANLYDINGRVMLTEKLDLSAGDNRIMLNASDLPPGVCLLQVIGDNEKASARLILGY